MVHGPYVGQYWSRLTCEFKLMLLYKNVIISINYLLRNKILHKLLERKPGVSIKTSSKKYHKS